MSQSIGPVETKFVTLGSEDEPFVFSSGATIGPITVAYETYGKLNADHSNAILLFHALSGNQHAAGTNTSVPHTDDRWTSECYDGWWDDFIGPGKALDTEDFFVICANYVGSCYGSSGPASIDEKTGKPYGPSFPNISVRDIVRSQAMLLDHLEIDRLHAVIGPSTGGLACQNFATTFPERTGIVIPIATGVKTTALNRIMLLEQILAIENDPHFLGGNYYETSEPPELGLALARMISHKSFVHLNTIERRASRDVVQPQDRFQWYEVHDQVESYMLHQGKKFVSRFDANSYLRICEMWSRFDPLTEGCASSPEELYGRSRDAGHQYLVFSISEDYCFYPEEQAHLVDYLRQADVNHLYITVHSDKGHDSFLLEPDLYAPHLAYVLRNGHGTGTMRDA